MEQVKPLKTAQTRGKDGCEGGSGEAAEAAVSGPLSSLLPSLTVAGCAAQSTNGSLMTKKISY